MAKQIGKSALYMLLGMLASSGSVSHSAAATPAPLASLATQRKEEPMSTHPYLGMWVTDDGSVRHALLPNGRYDEARGRRESAYQGRYELRGNYIQYWDDTGFTADGIFVDADTLHHGGMILRRRP